MSNRTSRQPGNTVLLAFGQLMGPLLCRGSSKKSITLLLLLCVPTGALAADPPPPPPAPSQSSTSGEQVTTGRGVETVSGTISDFVPVTEGVAFIKTVFQDPATDENVHLVKLFNEQFFPSVLADYYFIVGADLDANTVDLTRWVLQADNITFARDPSVDLSIQRVQTIASYNALFATTDDGSGTPAIAPNPTVSGGGLVIISQGANGRNGRAGALFVPPTSGADGGTPADINYVNFESRNATGGAGIEAGSIGGNGGNGGSAYLSFFGGRAGGTGGPGGTINITNAAGVQVSSSEDAHHGIYAYSISGTGGQGGSGFGAPSGGAGGEAFSGGDVTVTNQGNVFSDGKDAVGILALSRSGQGGAGGSQFGLFGSGGDGAIPGNGGKVTVTNSSTGRVQTRGDGSHGISALSVGGAGGAGGSSSNLFSSDAGAGGGGGDGDNVVVNNHGIILTLGNYSRGILAQSIGGGGGSGGFGYGIVAIGGTGSLGGSAGEVEVNNSGSITTEGVRSDGIFAQSVAGSGGSGGNAGGLVALGGGAGPGGKGNQVSVVNSGSIVTSTNLQRPSSGEPLPSIDIGGGVLSSQGGRGIVAQSIGGGGGDGGSAGGMVSVGGSGGSGNEGHTVTVVNSGDITTHGDEAQGIFAQSVGGGGGNGGSATAVGAFFAVGIGGSGGSGAHGGVVNLTLAGTTLFDPATIKTDGVRSAGVFAQSVGGGGGNGGGSTTVSTGIIGSVSVAIGGSGGSGGDGGQVELDDGTGGRANVTTGDDFSTGVLIQSVGGGGGNGGYATSVAVAGGPVGVSIAFGKGGDGGAGGMGGQVLVGHRATPSGALNTWDGSGQLQAAERGFSGSILTRGEYSPGFIAQSIGGGGGNGGASVTVAAAAGAAGSGAIGVGLGGNAGAGSDGRRVVVGMAGNVTTEGIFSPGILVQSVGGGGGNGGSSITAAAAFSGGVSGSVSVGIGGSGGAGSTGGNVSLATGQGLVWTKGDSSTGIIAQSIGGGGGNGGFNVSGALAGASGAAGAISVGLGGEGGAGGASGTVHSYLQSNVFTEGQNSTGILVQAVGGSGGSGGFNVSANLAGSGGGAGAISVGLGGKGGIASEGGTIEATATGRIATLGHGAAGFIAQSVGGGGGSGGFNVSASVAGGGVVGGSVGVGLGGSGGGGGAGGQVTAGTGDATDLPSVSTEGDNATGILAQSVGGGGGNGGFNVSAAVAGAGAGGAGSIGVGLGGSGGDGGDGGGVSLTVRNTVSTGKLGSDLLDPAGLATNRTGHHSVGVLAQSIGGGGGNGGFNVTAGVAGSGGISGGVGIGLGGDGAKGGRSASPVTLDMRGNISTLGDFASGLIAQSIGGGGGNGGFNVSAAISSASTASGQLSVGMGGAGGGGGSATGLVTSRISGNVTTHGDHAAGVTAQSLGGGGGNGGFNITGSIGGAGSGSASVAVGLGGSGGGGGSSGTSGSDLVVDNTVTGNITTGGKNAPGVIAQSIGGGGGSGGLNIAGTISGAGTGSGAISVGLGGSGGGGGNAATVRNTVMGNVTTTQGQSIGVLAQSLGGGGGNGGFNVSGAISGASEGTGAISVGIGGSGGDGGNSGASVSDVVVDNRVTGNVTTSGEDSTAVLAQSIGGGGGSGGFNVAGVISGSGNGSGAVSVGLGGSGGGGGHAGSIRNEVRGDVSTAAQGSAGIVSQSIGGGGGNGGFNISGGISASTGSGGGALTVGIGGSGGDGGQGGNVISRVSGDVNTQGASSTAILAQSVGGGGGNGGLNVSGSISLTKEGGGTLAVGIGGSGGGGGQAGDVTSTVTTATQAGTTTTGDDASAVLVQSIGGGGGNGGINVSAGLNVSAKSGGSLGVGVGGFGGDAGQAGAASATITGRFTTAGDRSNAIVVQSIGGGGGNGGLNVTGQLGISTQGSNTQGAVGIGGFGGKGGTSGKATLIRNGDTITLGRGSSAILVQSVAGGGGDGGINVSGGISAAREGSTALQFGLGGFGGEGGNADDVSATIRGNVFATGIGDGSAEDEDPSLFRGGVIAQSVGGGGGSGGLNVSGGISVADTSGGNTGKGATIGIGGFGGGGGNAGDVDLMIQAPGPDRVMVQVNGDQRAGVIAQSLGGGGGVGGINVSGGITTNSSLAFGLGGFGGEGGLGRAVSADIDADVEVTGDGARGLLAQSIGGGGGAGGINVSGTVNINRSDDTSITFGLGGFGGAGNISGDVDVTQKGRVIVKGENGIGILAQSVAGGGGDGGLNVSANIANAGSGKSTNRVIAGVGGTSGTGANAGNVSVNSLGVIAISGSSDKPDDEEITVFNSAGILAQSIGGGGGLGGMNISASVARNAGNTLQFGMGGSGGASGNAGSVSVTRGYETTPTGELLNLSSIQTAGDFSSGIVAQSVGGGGGSSGMNFNFAFNMESNPEDGKKYNAALISVGGSGADAGDADKVTIRHHGNINTEGLFSNGIVAQSIGGGGGSSSVNLGAGELGEKAKAINFGLGGANGAAGSGALVDVDHVGTIFMRGESSMGIKAQSIGGGGGSSTGINQFVDPVLDFITGRLDSASIGINIGREGGTGGTGGEVRLKSAGQIYTYGDQSIGILAQSIGGGGGDSGTTTVGGDFTAKSSSYGGNIAIGLDGGTAASGGVVTVNTSGEIATLGDRAHAIFAQSLGGGGGVGGTVGDKLALSTGEDEDTTNANISIGGDGGDGSFSQQVTVNNSAQLFSYGDRSSAIWVQSIGGTGGAGGDFLLADIENINGGITSRSFSLNVGGSGGTGAVGGGVAVTNSGFIQTAGLQSFGIRAESIGGGGGDGGAVSQGRLVTGSGSNQSVDIKVGGTGGDGGKGSLVEVTNEGIIHTWGLGADGIRATSTGGGGGNGGVMIDTLLTLTGAESQIQSLSMNFGGSGGTGGTGGDVKVHNTRIAGERSGEIMTLGDSAHGVFAQSLGGGGGNGTSIISMTGLRNTKDSFAVGLNFGGTGGSGNFAGAVTVDNSGTISTEGKNAYGILAQSTGGGGGNGGIVLSASAAFGQDAKSALLSIGGNGGDGRDGGIVTVTNSGEIFTSGDNGHGIVAQSIGGGGGNAGLGISATDNVANVVVSNLISLIAGATGGGKGGTGGEVKVIQTGNVSVTGKGAQAIVAESINGGGGRLTVDFSGIVGLPGSSLNQLKELFGYGADEEMPEPAVASRLGGVDLNDMNAGKVSIETAGIFAVNGSNGTGAFEQSLGGGGGSLFLTTSLGQQNEIAPLAAGARLSKTDEPAPIAFRFNLGGTGGVNNSGGDIKGISSGAIVTRGVNSSGLLSQSIGGGGGSAIIEITAPSGTTAGPVSMELGSRDGLKESGGNIERKLDMSIETEKDLSAALQIQSVGGGGGTASLALKGEGSPNLDLLLGAINTNDSVGGNLNISQTGNVSTFGNQSQGVSMQSIGGGGGRFIGSIESGLSQAKITLGADPSFNNHAGNLDLNFKGDTATSGNYSPGMVLQSIGAGGGQAYLSGLKSATVELGATDGSSGNAGDINIANIGRIITAGRRADGIVMQSIGGGGSYLITDLSQDALKLITPSDNKGDGGNISFDQQGDISTFGDESFGIIAQSLAGGGGVVDRLFMNTAGGEGTAGSINMHLNGNVLVTGKQSAGVFAQSRGSAGHGDISIDLAAGKFIRVNPDGVAVIFSGGARNLFDNRGAVIAAGPDTLPDGLIFKGYEGSETIINRSGGLIFGDLNLGGGNNQLVNEEGATAALGREIFIGQGPSQTFLNQGTVTPGDFGIYNSLITGNYEQTRTGALNINLDFKADQHDRLDITQQASLGGDLNVALSSVPLVKPGQRDLVFAATQGGISEKALQLNIAPSIVADYGIKYDAFNAFLSVNIDFASFGRLNPNQSAIGRYINRVQQAGSSKEMAPMINALFSMTELGPLKDAYNHLSPEMYISTITNLILASQVNADSLFKCDTKDGPNRFISESQCVWFDASIAGYTSDRTDDYFGYQSSAANVGAGIQWDLGSNWFASIGVGRTSYQTQFGDLISGSLDGFTNQAGVSIKKVMGATKVGLAFVGGVGNFQSDRRDVFPFGDTATASQNVSFIASRLRVSHDLEQRDWYVRPSLDFGISRVSQAGFRESGADAFNLVVSGSSTTTSLLAPAIHIGGEIKNGKLLIRPQAAVGYTRYLSDPSPEISARFAGAPGGASNFQVTGMLDQDYLDLSGGIDLIFHNGVSLKLSYTGQFSGNSTAHGAELRVAIPF